LQSIRHGLYMSEASSVLINISITVQVSPRIGTPFQALPMRRNT
jgi:hypothetical protein